MDMPVHGWRPLAVTADVQVKAGPGILHSVVITTPPSTGGVITLYDSLTETGTAIAVITLATRANGQRNDTLIFDCGFTTGLYVGYDGNIVAAQLTLNYN